MPTYKTVTESQIDIDGTHSHHLAKWSQEDKAQHQTELRFAS